MADGFNVAHRPILWGTPGQILDRRTKVASSSFIINHRLVSFGAPATIFRRNLATPSAAFLIPHRILKANDVRSNRRAPLIISKGFLLNVFALAKVHPTDTGFLLVYTNPTPKPLPQRVFDQREGDIDLSLINGAGGLTVISSDLERDPSFETAILISLLTDKRAREYDILPDPHGSPRGWWADAVQRDEIGSKLWLLERSKLDARATERAEHYVLDALSWMIEDGVAIKIETKASILSKDALGISISIYRTTDLVSKYFYNWNKQIIGKGS